jgi:hypothetical protein
MPRDETSFVSWHREPLALRGRGDYRRADPEVAMYLALALLLAGCTPAPDTAADDTGEAPPLEPLFSFAVLADPHLWGSEENAARAAAAVDWVNDHAVERGIEVALLVGDVAWGDGLADAPALLGALAVPWVPVSGDNEIQSGDEAAAYAAFAPQWAALAGQLDAFCLAPAPTWNPEHEQDSWFTNLAFEHRGVRFVGLDWATRTVASIFGEMADLHDFSGGTLPWLEAALAGREDGPADSVVFFSHHPMHVFPGAFDEAEIAALAERLDPWGEALYADFAGHYHVDLEDEPEGASWAVYATDAVWDDALTVRVVEVSGNGRRFAFAQELAVVE